MELIRIQGEFWISRLEPAARIVEDSRATFFSATRTSDELSVVASAPIEGARVEGPWHAFRVVGSLDFALTGVLNRLTTPLAEAGISVFALSTFDTDYLLVRTDRSAAAIDAWATAGFALDEASD